MTWRRDLFAWEEGEENHPLSLFGSKVPSIGCEDRWVWKVDVWLDYMVSSTYNCLRKLDGGDFRSLYEAFWSIKALPSSMTIAWRVLGDRLPACVNLAKRRVVLKNILGVMCGEVEESVSHIFFNCKVAWRVLCPCSRWLGECKVYHWDARYHFLQFKLG